MKKFFAIMSLVASASILFTNCSRTLDVPSTEKGTFQIFAQTSDTRTVNDGLATKWVAKDSMNVFHAVTGTTTYGTNDAFTIAQEDLAAGKFYGKLTQELAAGTNYDWYVLYPYNKMISTPAPINKGYMNIGSKSASAAQIQDGNDSKAHLGGQYFPLYAKATNVASDATPAFTLKQMLCVIKIVVTNNTGKDLTVENIAFTAPTDIIGSYYINFVGDKATFTSSGDNYVSKTAKLEVTNGAAIANGASAAFYMGIKPFDAAADDELTLNVNGYAKKITLDDQASFEEGAIKTLNFNMDGTAEIPTYSSLAELVAAGAPTAEGKLVNVTFVNEAITYIKNKAVKFNAGGQDVTVFGSVAAPTTWKEGGYVNGSLSKCTWILFSGSTWELTPSSWDALSCINPVEEPTITISEGLATITCETAGATIRYTLDETDPTETSSEYTEAVAMTDGQTIKAKAFKNGMPASNVASKKYSASGTKYSLTLPKSTLSIKGGTYKYDGITWTYSATGFIGFADGKGVQIGSSSNPQKSFTFSTDGFKSNTIKSITVNASIGSKGDAKLTISVGGTAVLSGQTLTTSATDYSVSDIKTKGAVEISFAATTKAYYLKSITIEY